ncbi:hypothetical protein J421_1478 [Gemmatirosa kalamazoonensis]|uniref:Uncharacterized protein n=1 Tax=Gemmatirosa kalamazoonensis TaxID=861299 RepID=W0RF99_9BACT|nr:hypothetical protein [Gemmatirosa kalamazoonensis]AHG89015.1 hypothetical protein J421_1478 [Gemmatirosa kalamazoonensis]
MNRSVARVVVVLVLVVVLVAVVRYAGADVMGTLRRMHGMR